MAWLRSPTGYNEGVDSRLVRIKRIIVAGHYDFTLKADLECAADGLTREDVIESILNSQFLRVKNSISPWRRGRREQIYIIDSFNFEGVPIYSKGVIRRINEHESEFYILISGKRAIASS
jgi:hypothetical protein